MLFGLRVGQVARRRYSVRSYCTQEVLGVADTIFNSTLWVGLRFDASIAFNKLRLRGRKLAMFSDGSLLGRVKIKKEG